MFGTLESTLECRKRWGMAFTSSFLSQVLLVGAAAFYASLFPIELPVTSRQYAVTWVGSLPPATQGVTLLPKEAPAHAPKLPLPEGTAAAELRVSTGLFPATQAVTPSIFVAPALLPQQEPTYGQPTLLSPESPSTDTGSFEAEAETLTTRLPEEKVQTGGFGSPTVFAHLLQRSGPVNGTVLGSFRLPEGAGAGNEKGGSLDVPGPVARADFDNRIARTVAGTGNVLNGAPKVALGGFAAETRITASPLTNPRVPPPEDFRPLEILFKPLPSYTEEARRMGIQGEVTLSVVFRASGALEVVRVIKPLGHGLDQAAQQAATQVRFKPAQQGSRPVDFPATLRIEFRLADQSS